MRLGKDLENKPIISVTDGRMLGRTKDVYVDSQLLHLAGLYLGSEGMIRRRAQVIPSADVVVYGIDVVLVKDSDVVTDNKALPEVSDWRRLKDLQGYEVHTPGGTKLGTVGDVILDENGSVTGLSLSRVFVKGPLAEQGTVQREVIVESSHEEEIIHVNLAMFEELAGGEEEQPAAKESPTEEPVEEIVIDAADVEEEVVVDAAEEQIEVDEAPLEISDEPDAAEEEGQQE